MVWRFTPVGTDLQFQDSNARLSTTSELTAQDAVQGALRSDMWGIGRIGDPRRLPPGYKTEVASFRWQRKLLSAHCQNAHPVARWRGLAAGQVATPGVCASIDGIGNGAANLFCHHISLSRLRHRQPITRTRLPAAAAMRLAGGRRQGRLNRVTYCIYMYTRVYTYTHTCIYTYMYVVRFRTAGFCCEPTVNGAMYLNALQCCWGHLTTTARQGNKRTPDPRQTVRHLPSPRRDMEAYHAEPRSRTLACRHPPGTILGNAFKEGNGNHPEGTGASGCVWLAANPALRSVCQPEAESPAHDAQHRLVHLRTQGRRIPTVKRRLLARAFLSTPPDGP